MADTGKRLLVPVDFQVPSRAALSLARDLAGPLGASIDVLHVIDLPVEPAVPSEGHVPVPEEYRQALVRQARAHLADWLRTTATPGGVAQQIAEGKPAEEIARYASDRGTYMIVMGTHGHGGISHLLTGSVAATVVRTAPCPVVTVRGPQT